ncbi:MAG: hypothetical protein L0229_26385 [Blastocatellia bacterium]|nr:hypothetical protein [Blastocatellia bacterium]
MKQLEQSDKDSMTGRQIDLTDDFDIPGDWLEEFEAAARRPLATRLRYSFIRTYKPVLDDASYRAFDTMEDYRRWCEENLPEWLGYGRV